jgi:type II secretory pathway predicted ATPase ExeA
VPEIYDGDLVALCGVVGSGKTMMLRRLQDLLARENRVIVAKSISVEKSRATLGTLITALFCDLSPDKEPKIPKQGELRERELRNLVRKRKKPIVLMVDEAHDLHHYTLTGLKRLIEMVADGDGKLCVLLAGIPSSAVTCATRRWRRSATAPRSSRSRASPAASASTSNGC